MCPSSDRRNSKYLMKMIPFKTRVRIAYEEWKETGSCKEAKLLNQAIGSDYFDTSSPHFFTGDINSDLVLIHLNPKRNINNWYQKCHFPSFESYWDWHENFGRNHYGKASSRTHKSPFDHKQIRFLRPFGLLSLENSDKFQNLENVIDAKLQLELIPFGSPSFSYHKLGLKHLTPFIDSLLSVIMYKERKYTIFCGRVFEHILNDKIIDKKIHNFKLKKADDTLTKSDFQVINILLKDGTKSINACIAPQFAKQGYPVMEYGKKIKELYGLYD